MDLTKKFAHWSQNRSLGALFLRSLLILILLHASTGRLPGSCNPGGWAPAHSGGGAAAAQRLTIGSAGGTAQGGAGQVGSVRVHKRLSL